MMTPESAKKAMDSLTKAAADRMDHATINEKIAGAAAIGVAVGVAATALGSALLHSGATPSKTAKDDKKAAVSKD